jgi:hypothetical protein
MPDVEPRIAALEAKVESAFAIDSRLKSLEGEVRRLKGGSSIRDWLQTLGPYVAGLVVLFVGYWIKDSVALALQREQLDLQYVMQMRDLIKDFDQAQDQQTANADAVALSMYGKHAIIPLVERLEGGDVAALAAERGLRLVGSNDPEIACPRFVAVINDRSRRYKWQTHKTMIKVIGQSACVEARADLQQYRKVLTALGGNAADVAKFARRYSEVEAFDIESASSLTQDIDNALEILDQQVTP